MNDLISRKAAIEALSRGEGCGHVCRNAIKRIPSVPAVPLEPLCQWLAGYAVPPDYALEYVIGTNAYWQDAAFTEENMREAWEYHFRNLFECGLLKSQEPIEPEEIINDKYPVGDNNRYGGWRCGKCKEGIPWDANYCPYCGQAVKWND